MAKKQNKNALKRLEAKRHRRATSKKGQPRSAPRPGRPTRFAADMANDRVDPPKLSEVLLDYAAPLMKKANSESGEKSAITLSICYWNASILPSGEAREQIEPLLDGLADGDLELKKDMLEIFTVMQARKLALYAHDRRFVIDYSLTEDDDGLHLQVASVPMETKKQDLPYSPNRLTAVS